MSYEKYYPNGWQSGETGGTPITPEALNHMEQGIANLDSEKAPAESVLKTYFAIPKGGHASIAFSGTTNAMIYCRGWSHDLAAVLNYSGYAAGDTRQNLTTIVNSGLIACGLNKESAGQGLTIYNGSNSNALHVVIDSRIEDTPPVITYTADNAVELYIEYPNPPMVPGVEYRTTERWNGKVVYAQALNVGVMPNNSTVDINHKIANLEYVVERIATTPGYVFPVHWRDTAVGSVEIYVNPNRIMLYTTADWSAYSCIVGLKYTKTTD